MASRRPIEIELSEDEGGQSPLARLERELGRALVDEGLLTAAELAEANARQASAGGRLTTCVLELGFADEVRLRGLCGRVLRVPTALPDDVAAAPPALLGRVERELAVHYRVIPFARSGSALLVATAEPWRLPLLDSLAARAGGPVEPRFLDEAPLARLLGRLYGAPVDPRFAAEPPPARPGRATPRPRVVAAPEPPSAELLSETGFARLYESGPGTPVPGAAEAAGQDTALASSTPTPNGVIRAGPGAECAALGRARLDPARIRPLAALAEARAALASAGDAEQIGWLLARVALARARRTVLLVWDAGAWLGRLGAGEGVDARVAAALMVPAAPGSAFEALARTGASCLGALAEHPVHARFLALAVGGAPREAALVAVPCEGRPALALYADGGPGAALGAGAQELAAFAALAGAALDRLAREARQTPAGGSNRTPGSSAGR